MRHLLLAAIAHLVVGLSGSVHTARAAPVIFLGDSWSRLASWVVTDPEFKQDFGFDFYDATISAVRASKLAADRGIIDRALDNNPNAEVVHLSVSGAEVAWDWSPSLPDERQEVTLQGAVDSVIDIAEYINASRPDIEIVHVSYDFLPPQPGGASVEQSNAAFLDLTSRFEALDLEWYTYVNLWGLAQVTYGIPEEGIPAGDTSLPRIDLPSPAEVWFDDLHLNRIPMYNQTLAAFEAYRDVIHGPACDVNDDSMCDVADLDLIGHQVATGGGDAMFDLDGDKNVDVGDVNAFLIAVNSLPGDSDLNGSVEFADFLALSQNFGQSDKRWSNGDFDANGKVPFPDFLILADNFGQSVAITAAAVPEPTNALLALFGTLGLIGFRRRR